MPRIVIADPDPASRNALLLWLIYKFGAEEIVQAEDGEALQKIIAEQPPGLILMDWSLPARPSAQTCRAFLEENPATRWIILSVDEAVADTARQCSPWFVRKGSSPDEILSLVNDLMD